MLSLFSLRHFIKQSLPTPLGPLITMIKGLGVGIMGSELNDEPRDDSKARYNSYRSADAIVGVETTACLRESFMFGK